MKTHWLWWVLLGPITGLLMFGAIRHRRRDPVLSWLYAAAAALWRVDSAAILRGLLTYIGRHA